MFLGGLFKAHMHQQVHLLPCPLPHVVSLLAAVLFSRSLLSKSVNSEIIAGGLGIDILLYCDSGGILFLLIYRLHVRQIY